jgi:uncharacterized protein (TIGR00369 family)
MSNRTRTFSWHDPTEIVNAIKKTGGRRTLEAIISGEHSMAPSGYLMNFRLVSLGDRSAMIEFTPAEFHYNLIGSVHGGVITTVLDSAMACAVLASLPQGTIHTTLEFKVNFLRGILVETGRMRAEGRVMHLGTRIATAEARMTSQDGKLYAHATTTCLIASFPETDTGKADTID